MIARKAIAGAVVATALSLSHTASATPRWVDRLLTLPGPVAGTLDLDGSIGHADTDVGAPCGYCGYTGLGNNLAGTIGIASRVDIGIRVGLRGFIDREGVNEGVVSDADAYGRMFDQVAFYAADTGYYGNDVITNPELKVRVRILNIKHLFELGVEVRHNLPFLNNTFFGFTAGVPMALHFGHHVRFDFGGYTNFTFYDRANPRGTLFSFIAPAAFWFQVHNRVYLGPMFGFRWYSEDVYASSSPANRNWDFMLGFGLGVSLAKFVDFQTQVYFPRLNDAPHWVGAGAGVQFYFW